MTITPLGFNIDGSIGLQHQLVANLSATFDWRSQEDSLRLFSGSKAIQGLKLKIQELRQRFPEPWLAFLGSGDLHHLTLLLLETLPEGEEPVTLVLIDNHPDWFSQWPKYHCGNWVSSTIQLPRIQSAILMGQDSADIRGSQFWLSPYEAWQKGRIALYPYRRKSSFLPLKWPKAVPSVSKLVYSPLGTTVRFNTLAEDGPQGFFEAFGKRLMGQSIYLSIDKDCLCPENAMTDWDQGQMSLADIEWAIKILGQTCKIVGADVCGDIAMKPLAGFFKRLDAGRLFESHQRPQDHERINEQTNLAILKAFKSINTQELNQCPLSHSSC